MIAGIDDSIYLCITSQYLHARLNTFLIPFLHIMLHPRHRKDFFEKNSTYRIFWKKHLFQNRFQLNSMNTQVHSPQSQSNRGRDSPMNGMMESPPHRHNSKRSSIQSSGTVSIGRNNSCRKYHKYLSPLDVWTCN